VLRIKGTLDDAAIDKWIAEIEARNAGAPYGITPLRVPPRSSQSAERGAQPTWNLLESDRCSCLKELTWCAESRTIIMPYTIVFSTSDTQGLLQADTKTALEALTTIGALQRRGEEIKYITSPQEGEIGVEMLRVLAREEEEELQAGA
jgi:hypothetical protein